MQKILVILVSILLVGCSLSSGKVELDSKDNIIEPQKGEDKSNENTINSTSINNEKYRQLLSFFYNVEFDRDYLSPFVKATQDSLIEDSNKLSYLNDAKSIIGEISEITNQIYNYDVPKGYGLQNSHDNFITILRVFEMDLDNLLTVTEDNGSLGEWSDYFEAINDSRHQVRMAAANLLNLTNGWDNSSSSSRQSNYPENNSTQRITGEEAKNKVEVLLASVVDWTKCTICKLENGYLEQLEGKNYFVIVAYEDHPDHVVRRYWFYVEEQTGLVFEWNVVENVLIPIETAEDLSYY